MSELEVIEIFHDLMNYYNRLIKSGATSLPEIPKDTYRYVQFMKYTIRGFPTDLELEFNSERCQ